MMTDSPERPQENTAPPIHERVKADQAELKTRAKTLQAVATALGPLTKPQAFADIKKLDPLLAKARKKIESFTPVPKLAVAALDAVEFWRQDRKTALRDRLGRDLKTACDAADLPMRVISREQPVEVRIPPFAVVLDFDRASAELRFARDALTQVPADPEAIVSAVAKTRDALEKSVTPGEFFDRCLAAWKASRGATGSAERVEILDFLPYLAVGMQRPKFKAAPTKANFASYTRAQFAYDIMRLRRHRSLSRNGYRLNLGVATGTTASEKKRVVYMEDEEGNGEYKLTVYFTKDEDQA